MPALVAISFGAGAVAVALRRGPGLSFDSVAYASTLRVLEETGVWSFSPLWPPGYPLVVTLTGTGHGLQLLNVLAVVGHLLLVSAIAATVLRNQRLVTLSVALVATSTGLVFTYAMAWSEPLFILLVDLSLLALAKLVDRGWETRWVAILMVSANGAGLFRYSSISLYLTIGIALLILGRREGRRGVLRAFVTVMMSALSAFAVAGSNLSRGWDALGPRMPSQYDLVEVMLQLPAAASLHLSGGLSRSVPLGVLVLSLLTALIVAWLVGTRPVLNGEPAMVLLVWVTVSGAFLVLSEARTNIDALDFRLLAPVVPGLVILVIHASEALLEPRWAAVLGWSTLAYCAVAATVSLTWAVHVGPWTTFVIERPSEQSEIDAAVDRAVPGETPIVSDSPWQVVLATRRDQVVAFPDAGPWPHGRPYWVSGSTLSLAEAGDVAVVFDPSLTIRPSWREIGRQGTIRIFEVEPG